MTAIDFVERLSLETGAYGWQRKLGRTPGYNSSRWPRLQQSVLVVQEHNVYRRCKLKKRELRFDAETGVILSGVAPDLR